MKAQVQPISLVLISGIIISLAGAAYIWGKPLIEKRTTIIDVTTAENFILELDKTITDIAKAGGEKSLNLPIKGSIRVNESNNSIILQFMVMQPMLGNTTTTIPIETTHLEEVGVYGEQPRIITLSSEPVDGQYKMTLVLHYRELDINTTIPKRGYKIQLTSTTEIGTQKVSVAYDKTDTLKGAAANDGDLTVTYLRVNVI